MLRRFATLNILSVPLMTMLVGCGGGTNPGQQTTKNSATNGTVSGKNAAAAADDAPGLKELDEADRKLAEQQKYCPKTGELLGSMGKPYKMTLNGRVVFLCCDGCEEAVKADPEKYLKKLDALMAKK